MAVSRVGVDSPFSNQKFRAALTDIFAGTICSILSIAYCLSYAALIFTGPLEHLLSYGVAVTFLSAAVGGSIVALRSSLPFSVAGPDSNISVVLAALVATVVQRVVADGGTDLLEPALIALSLATAITGLLLCVLGFTHAGRAIRFVPYPVIGGFLGATGWLMITGAIQVVANQRPTLTNIRVPRRRDRRQALLRRGGGDPAASDAAALEKSLHSARSSIGGIRSGTSCPVIDRLDAC